MDKIVKASSDSVIPKGFHPSTTPQNPLDNMKKMKIGAPGPSTSNKLGTSGGSQVNLGAVSSMVGGLVDAIGSATGLNLDNIDADAAKRAGIGGKVAIQGFISSLPGASTLVGMFGGRTAKSYKSVEIDQMTNAYGGSVADINAAQALSGKRMLGTGKALVILIYHKIKINMLDTLHNYYYLKREWSSQS